MRPAPSTVIAAAIVACALCALHSASALPLRQLHRALQANADAAEQQQRGGAWVEAELERADRVAVDIDIDETAGDAVEADAVTDAVTDAQLQVQVQHQLVPKMVAVTVAGTGVNVQCQLMVDANNENTVNAAFLQPLCGCVLLKQALNVVDDLPPLNSAQWVTQVTRTNPEWAKNAVKTVAKMVWNAGSWLTSHWGVIDPYDHPNGAAAYNADILAGIKPADVITVQLAALDIVSGVLSDPAPAPPNNVARSCLVVPHAANPTLTHALVHTCATALRARALLPAIVYTFTRDDTTARNPDLALNAAINGALSLTIQLPAAVNVLHNVDGQAQATLNTWIRRAHATAFGDNLVAAVNAHPAMSTHVPALVINGQGPTKNAVCAGRGQVGGMGPVVDLPAVTYNGALNPDHLIRIEHWSEVVGGVIPNGWFPTPLVSSLLGAPPAQYPANANVNVDNIKVNVAGGASEEVFFINAVSGDMTSANGGHQLAARQAAEAAFVAASGVARHAMTVAGVMTTLFEFGAPPGGGANRNRAQLNGPSRTLRRALQTAAHSNVAAVTHFGFGYFALTVRLVPRTLTFPGNGDMLPVKQVGWLGFADNHALNQGPQGGGAAGAGMHTEQRIMEQLRRFVLRLETPIGGGNGHAFKVAGMRSRWITEYDPDHADDNNCQWMFKFMRVAATQGYFRTRPYDEVVRAAGAAAGAPWDLAQTRANLGALRAQDVISWTDPIDHYIYERFGAAPGNLRTPFARRREAYRLAILAGNAQSFPDAVSENTWGNEAHPGDGHPPPNNFFDLA